MYEQNKNKTRVTYIHIRKYTRVDICCMRPPLLLFCEQRRLTQPTLGKRVISAQERLPRDDRTPAASKYAARSAYSKRGHRRKPAITIAATTCRISPSSLQHPTPPNTHRSKWRITQPGGTSDQSIVIAKPTSIKGSTRQLGYQHEPYARRQHQ